MADSDRLASELVEAYEHLHACGIRLPVQIRTPLPVSGMEGWDPAVRRLASLARSVGLPPAQQTQLYTAALQWVIAHHMHSRARDDTHAQAGAAAVAACRRSIAQLINWLDAYDH